MPKNFNRKAFTLPELIISLAVTALLMTGMGSAMLLASRAVPSDDEPLKAQLTSYQALEKIATELAVAKTIVSRTPTFIEFTVEDRDADLIDETFKYSWTGIPGETLFRLESSTSVWEAIATNIYNFTLDYNIRTNGSGISRLHAVNLHLQIGGNPDSTVALGVQLLNAPQVTP